MPSHQRLNVNCVHRCFVATSFSLVDECAYSQSFCGFFLCDQCKYVFVSEQNRANILLGKYFSANVLNDWVLRGSWLHSTLVHSDFWAQIFHKVVYWCVWSVVGCLIIGLSRNLLLSLLVKEFWKSVCIWQVRGRSRVAPFYQIQCSNFCYFSIG